MGLVSDRRCDACGEIRAQSDNQWWALIPPGFDGEDKRKDFCDIACLKSWAKKKHVRKAA